MLLIVVIAGCATSEPVTPPDPPVNNDPIDQEPEPDFDFALYQPNELGEIPVWMYHVIGDKEAIWTRTPDNFRADLQRFYDLGYRLVSLTDVITNNIDIPAGTSPIVLTFDDGTASHFNLIKDENGEITVDPDCAVGIIMEFAERHPDMGTAATFFVNFPHPFSQHPSTSPWYTGEHLKWKLEKVQEWGMEIGNHTWGHPHLTKNIVSIQHLQEQLGKPQQWIQDMLPGYKLNSLALPFGSRPIEEWREYLYSGEFDGVSYQHDVVLLVGSHPANPFNHINYAPLAMPRVRASNFPEGNAKDFLDNALNRLENSRYISDGDPDIITIPESMLPKLNEDSLKGKELRTYNLDNTQ